MFKWNVVNKIPALPDVPQGIWKYRQRNICTVLEAKKEPPPPFRHLQRRIASAREEPFTSPSSHLRKSDKNLKL